MEAKMEANGTVRRRTWRGTLRRWVSPHVARGAPDSAATGRREPNREQGFPS